MKNKIKRKDYFDDRDFEEKVWDNIKDYSLALFSAFLLFAMGWAVNKVITIL